MNYSMLNQYYIRVTATSIGNVPLKVERMFYGAHYGEAFAQGYQIFLAEFSEGAHSPCIEVLDSP